MAATARVFYITAMTVPAVAREPMLPTVSGTQATTGYGVPDGLMENVAGPAIARMSGMHGIVHPTIEHR